MSQTTETATGADDVLARIEAFGAAYDYDASYLADLFRSSPGAFGAFAPAQGVGAYRDALERDAHHVARIATMQALDCGACAQLNLRMAVEDGVDRDLLATLLRAPGELPEPLADVHRHALDAAGGGTPDPERVARLRERLGDEAFGELATAIVGASIYPTLKRALGRMTACRAPTLDF